ncbi:hypothetical protein [Paracoccus aerodenitrificans]|uniref:hypothetical protein n=1 Tax=Paracoccus aerodenitrificans TaxID=3017781 RepID=UPI0022F090BF|nr:hypothetical protein [Paracoccus aerodenitrificans]WBU65011.1 hypothetical protein PAE61_06155 [Paracoccus aerodenitrificans]
MHFFTFRRTVLGTICFILLAVLLGAAEGDITDHFGEGKIGTVVSGILLALIGLTNFRIWQVRRSGQPFRLSAPENLWLLLSVAFFFLFLDESFQIHEAMDQTIHRITGITETAVTDRIDDLIILAYGLIGVAILFFYRHEVTRIPGLVPFMVAAFALTVLQTGFDALSNGNELLTWFGLPEGLAESLYNWANIAEEALKLLAEAALLAGFAHALRYLRGGSPRNAAPEERSNETARME